MKVRFLILDDNTLVDLTGAELTTALIKTREQSACELKDPVKEEGSAPAEAQAPVAAAFEPGPTRFFTLYEGANVEFTLGSKVYLDQYSVERNRRNANYIGVLKIDFNRAGDSVRTVGSKADASEIRHFVWNGASFEKQGYRDAADAKGAHPGKLVVAVGLNADDQVAYVAAV